MRSRVSEPLIGATKNLLGSCERNSWSLDWMRGFETMNANTYALWKAWVELFFFFQNGWSAVCPKVFWSNQQRRKVPRGWQTDLVWWTKVCFLEPLYSFSRQLLCAHVVRQVSCFGKKNDIDVASGISGRSRMAWCTGPVSWYAQRQRLRKCRKCRKQLQHPILATQSKKCFAQ